MRIGLFFNRELEASSSVARAISSADYGGADVGFATGDAFEDHGELDLAISIGGDGTFLLTANAIMGRGIPLYGINTGRLGFLASGEPRRAIDDVRKIIAGEYDSMPVIPLRGEVTRCSRLIERVWVLNEIMIVKNFISRPIALSVTIGGEKLYSFLADGIIVATPVGSTAYALSAGGPVAHPGVECIEIIPVCPHSLHPRPIIVPRSAAVKIIVEPSPCGAILAGDGHNSAGLCEGDEVVVTSDDGKKIDVLSVGGGSYLGVLRNKLGWS
jgi:NAD+ kinase